MGELLPCPFCGSAFKYAQEPEDNHPVGGMFYLYHDYGPLGSAARSCPLEFNRHFDTLAIAADAWNRRASSTAMLAGEPEPEAVPDFHDDEIHEAIEELQSAAVMADQEPMEALFSDTALLVRFLIRQRDQANSEKVRLREALQFYANPEIYKPHPHGPAFDQRDVSYVARAAIAKAESRS